MNAPSRRSVMITAAGLIAVGGIWAGLALLDPDGFAFLALADLGEAVMIAVSAGIVFYAAAMMEPGRFQTRWLVIGAGVASYAIGDFIWSYVELVQRAEVPYPGLPDAFYIAEYLLLGGAVIAAGVAYKGIIDIKRPAITAAAVTAVVAVVMWFTFIAPLAADTASSNAERLFNVLYPMADVILLMGPSLFTVLVVAQLGGGKLGRPWLAVAVGTIILAASDTAFSWMMATDTYRPGTIVDVGWMVAHVAIAFGALMALDLVGTRVRTKPVTQSV